MVTRRQEKVIQRAMVLVGVVIVLVALAVYVFVFRSIQSGDISAPGN